MKPASSGSKVALWVALGILGLIVLGVIILGIIVFSFMRSTEGKNFTSTISKLAEISEIAPDIADAIGAYTKANGKFPARLEDLQPTLDAGTYKAMVDNFKYTPPADADPPDKVILTTEDWPSLMGATLRLEVTRDFTCRQVQITPMNQGDAGVKVKVDAGTGALRPLRLTG
jgi:hypothetical protein